MARNNYSKEIKAAVMAALLEGQSITQVARDYDIPSGTIKSWKNRQESENSGGLQTDATRKNQIADLVIELLAVHLESAMSIARAVANDEEYLKSQDASQIAVLLGVINDKSFRLLEALGRAEDRQRNYPED